MPSLIRPHADEFFRRRFARPPPYLFDSGEQSESPPPILAPYSFPHPCAPLNTLLASFPMPNRGGRARPEGQRRRRHSVRLSTPLRESPLNSDTVFRSAVSIRALPSSPSRTGASETSSPSTPVADDHSTPTVRVRLRSPGRSTAAVIFSRR